MERKLLLLEDLEVYQLSNSLAEDIWAIVAKWGFFEKDTVGKQMVRSADSIAANIAEGYGRFHYKENKLFCFYGRGSIMETKTWLTKAKNRNLIDVIKYTALMRKLETTHKKLNGYIKSIGRQGPTIKAPPMSNDRKTRNQGTPNDQ